MDSVSYTLLTTVDIHHHGRPAAISACKVRTVLAVLLLNAGRPVSIDALVDEVWTGEPPASAVKNLRLYVHRLRRILDAADPGAGAQLRLAADGYCLHVDRAAVDLFAAEDLARRAQVAAARGLLAEAASLVEQALSGWSDHPLGGVTHSPGLVAAIDQIQERRLTLLERWCELDLAAGRFTDAIDRLRPVVARYPLRERPHALLITALGRGGQRAAAIEVFHRLRHGLDDALAIHPGPAVRAAYQELITT